ncbi:PBP family phospholipid-binding protein [Anseongella ginsenosidimutans]|uniref:PBP family phospholipid-binding protein n=1 Tax=Anseongella ginsenosidimutans TaxID=496056 RepID=A0A4R3KQP8_9SPHI|nr:YbhB/YbcL family Raf kinase inhibitor-like protein [Anseongella ginsenosidimutans]TCS87248.1 PBP family phospholipid-binding protein [Anseongella ginsenosidimutans]
MQILSVFKEGEAIPTAHTCLGPNISPPLELKDIPAGTQSLVLIVEDIDAAPKAWTHWLVFNIPPGTGHVNEGKIPSGAIEGLSNNHTFGYEGPCPKYFSGTHHYWFRLYALDIVLGLPRESEREAVEEKMNGHILEEAVLTGSCTS